MNTYFEHQSDIDLFSQEESEEAPPLNHLPQPACNISDTDSNIIILEEFISELSNEQPE